MMKKNSIALNAILNTVQTILSILFPLITYPYCSRILGVEGMGKYGFSYSIVSYFVLLSGLGIKTYAIREGARVRENKKKLNILLNDIYSINIYSMIFSYFLLFLSILISKKLNSYSFLIIILSLQLFFITIGKDYIYVIFEDYLYITVRQLFFQLLSLISLFFLVKSSENVPQYCFVTILGMILSNILNYFDSKRYISVKFTFKPNLRHLKSILLIFSTSIGIVVYASSDTTILGFFGNDFNVGIYNTSVKIYSTVKQAVAAILTVSIPRFSYYLGKKDYQSYTDLFENLFDALLYIMLPCMVGLFMLSKEIIIIIAGSEYISATLSLKILTFAMIFNLLSYMYGYCVLIPRRKDKEFMYATLVGASVNVILNFIFIPLFYENAAASTTFFAELCVFICTLYFCKGYYINKINRKEIAISIIGCIFVFGSCFIIKQFFHNPLFIIIISFFVSVLIYCVITFLFGSLVVKRFLLYVKTKR